jgi:hypothetical protein
MIRSFIQAVTMAGTLVATPAAAWAATEPAATHECKCAGPEDCCDEDGCCDEGDCPCPDCPCPDCPCPDCPDSPEE